VGIESRDHGKFPAQKFYTGVSAQVPHLMAVENSRRDSESNGIMKHANMHFMTVIKGLVALAAALAPLACAADTVYKYQYPDGRIVYSDSPVRGARLIGRYLLLPQPPDESKAKAPPGIADPDQVARQRSQALDASAEEIKAAERALTIAQERQQSGVEPLPGERAGNASGRGSRLRPEYFARQRQLASDVEQAQARLDEAWRGHNQLRD
jgi:hypothetical protein